MLGDEHRSLVSLLDALRGERDPVRAAERLAALRRAWIVHALAEESVVYRALETAAQPLPRSAERFVEHEMAGVLFERLAHARPGSLEWRGRLNVARDLVARHFESEERELHAAIAARFAPDGVRLLAERYVLARDKLLMLEQAKAA